MNAFKLLKSFCKKHGVKVPDGDDFSLMDFLVDVSSVTARIVPAAFQAERKARELGADSGKFGGCPSCGSLVTLSQGECHVCGMSLVDDSEEQEEEKKPAKAGRKKKEVVEEEESEDDEEEEEEEESEEEDEDSDSEEEEDEEESEDEDSEEDEEEDSEEEEDDEEEDSDSEEEEDEEESEEDEEEDSEEEDEEEESDDEEEESEDEESEEEDEPLSTAKKGAIKKSFDKKRLSKHSEKKLTGEKPDPREKKEQRDARRKEIKAMLPKLAESEKKLAKLPYRELLVVAGLLGSAKPMSLGDTDQVRKWVAKSLKKKFGTK